MLHSRLASRLDVWLWGSRYVDCLAYVYVSSELESRSQHQVCPRSLGGAAIGATLRHNRLERIQDWGQGQGTGSPGKERRKTRSRFQFRASQVISV